MVGRARPHEKSGGLPGCRHLRWRLSPVRFRLAASPELVGLQGDGICDPEVVEGAVWLTLNQMTELFGRDKSVISRHLRIVFASGELERAAYDA